MDEIEFYLSWTRTGDIVEAHVEWVGYLDPALVVGGVFYWTEPPAVKAASEAAYQANLKLHKEVDASWDLRSNEQSLVGSPGWSHHGDFSRYRGRIESVALPF